MPQYLQIINHRPQHDVQILPETMGPCNDHAREYELLLHAHFGWQIVDSQEHGPYGMHRRTVKWVEPIDTEAKPDVSGFCRELRLVTVKVFPCHSARGMYDVLCVVYAV